MIIFSCDASQLIAVVPWQSRQSFLGCLREWDSLRCCWFGTDTWRVRLTFEDGSFRRFTIRLEFLDNHSRHTIYPLSPSLKCKSGPRSGFSLVRTKNIRRWKSIFVSETLQNRIPFPFPRQSKTEFRFRFQDTPKRNSVSVSGLHYEFNPYFGAAPK
jgi:hypothetical protein